MLFVFSFYRHTSARKLFNVFIILLVVFVIFTFIAYYFLVHIKLKNISNLVESFQRRQVDELTKRQELKYCNSPDSLRLEEESSTNVSPLLLTKVLLLIRHGDRGPLRPVKHLGVLTCHPKQTGIDASLLKVLVQFTHDVEHKLKFLKFSLSYPLIPNDSKCQVGQLNYYGFLQHLILGSLIGNNYKDRLQLSSKEEIKVRTTDYHRTFQSAIAFLYGFFDPKSSDEFEKLLQIETTRGIFFCTSDKFCLKKCNQLEKLYQEMINFKRNLLEANPKIQKLINHLRFIISPNLNVSESYQTPIQIFDGLMAFVCHGYPLPCDSNGNCATLEDIQKLYAFIQFQGKQMAASTTYKHLSWLKVAGFLNELADEVKNPKTRFSLYSGHDVTIVALASALGFFDGNLPQYASRVVFEVYTDDKGSHYFKIIYNGKDVTGLTEICQLNFDNCLNQTQISGPLINVDYFNKFISERFESVTKAKNYENACKT